MPPPKGKPAKPSTNGTAPTKGEPERLPAYFLSLTVENVRCFGPKQTLDLSDGNGKPAPWTIILGQNGTGKTTLLQSLVGFEIVTTPPIFAGNTLPRFFLSLPRVLLSRDLNTLTTELKTEISTGSSVGEEPEHVLTFTYQQNGTHRRNDSIPLAASITPWCCAYGVSRRFGSEPLNPEVDDSTATLFSDHAELRKPEEWLLQLDYASAKTNDKDAQHRLAQVKELLLAIMPEDEITDIRCEAGSGLHPKPRVEFHTPYGWVPLRQLGYGYQTLITWVADLANRMAERYPDSKNPLAEPSVVLVDEIDLHLHPKWQRKLMSFLTERFPNTQFIATAHSPLVVQAAADANLAVLRREGDHVVIDNEVDNIRNWRVDQILTSDLFGLETARPPQIEALMLERKALLTKPKLNATDKKRLAEVEAKMGELPMGETTQEIEERRRMLELLESLAKERKVAP